MRPGVVVVSLSAYGERGPWAGKRGFDSPVQSASGFNLAEAQAAGSPTPQALPLQILDMASGALMAFCAQAALLRQQAEGGCYHVRLSLARTGHWLRWLGRVDHGFEVTETDAADVTEVGASGWGELRAARPAARLSETPAGFTRASMPPGSHALAWPGA